MWIKPESYYISNSLFNSVQEIDFLRVVIALSFFIYASASDWRTRRVKNIVWIVLGIISFAILWLDMLNAGAPLIAQTLLLPLAFLFADIFWDREKNLRKPAGMLAAALYVVSFVWMAYVGYAVVAGDVRWSDVSGPFIAFFVVIIFELFYMFDVIRGGADAKAVICLAILFPSYPDFSSAIPLIQPAAHEILTFFPFALSVLFMGALISIAVPLYFLIRNIRNGKKAGLKSLLGFTLPIDEVEGRFVWLMEWVEAGQVKFSYRKPRESNAIKADLAGLRDIGRKEVWVTYKIPFILPLTLGLIFVLVVGNLLFLVY